MKYLKVFNESVGIDKFEKMDPEEFRQMVFGTTIRDSHWNTTTYTDFVKYEEEKWQGFTDKQLLKMQKFMGKYLPGASVFERFVTGRCTKYYINIHQNKEINIYCLKDDWFYIQYESYTSYWGGSRSREEEEYFKCDQWDGLIDCLKNLV